MQYKLVIFDLDGTLMDTQEGVLSAVDYAVAKMGLDRLSSPYREHFVGPPIEDSFMKSYSLSEFELHKVIEIYRKRYNDYDLLKALPYAGIYDLLKLLKKYNLKIAIATYKKHLNAIPLLDHFKFNDYYDVAYGADPDNKLKKSDLIKKCIEDLKVSPDEAVMIGDTKLDAIGSEQIGCDFIGVTYGFGFKSKDDVKEYKNIGAADTIEELGELLLKNN